MKKYLLPWYVVAGIACVTALAGVLTFQVMEEFPQFNWWQASLIGTGTALLIIAGNILVCWLNHKMFK